MKSFTATIVLSLLTVMAVSCKSTGQSETAPGPYHELSFTVDSTKLGTETTVGNISLRVPKGWNAADFKKLTKVQEAAKQDTTAYSYTPVAIYGSDTSGTALLLMNFNHPPKSKGYFTDWARTYIETVRKEKPFLKMEEDWLLLGGMQAVQLKISDSLRVQFKYIFNESPPIGATYVIPNNKWEFEGRSVESSLGTIRRKG